MKHMTWPRLATLLLVIVVALSGSLSRLTAQSIVTVAGGGVDDGRPATLASIVLPYDVTLDEAGNLYIAENEGNRIRRVDATTGIISTVAGIGVAAFAGDDGPATEASLSGPGDVAIGPDGHLYIADVWNNRIRKVDLITGIISTIAGGGDAGQPGPDGDGGLATEARLFFPSGIAFDPAGDLYIAQWGDNRIRKVDHTTGIISAVAGNGDQGYSGDGGPATVASFDHPERLVIGPKGRLYIADRFNHRIRRVDLTSGLITTVAGNGPPGVDNGLYGGDGGPATEAQLNGPLGIAFDSAGNLYISDSGNRLIRKVDTAGIIIAIAGNGGWGYRGDGGPATEAWFRDPDGVAIDASGNLYIADTYNHRIRRVEVRTGIITTVAGAGTERLSGDGGPATGASLSSPTRVGIGPGGDLYVADSNNNRIRRVDVQTGLITTVAGNGGTYYDGDGVPATEASLWKPTDVAVGPGGDFFIADSWNVRIRKVDSRTGIITTVAGNGERGYSGEGGPATQAALTVPIAVAVGPTGDLYIADHEDSRIRKVDAITGIITTVAGTGDWAYSGDGGPATQATIQQPSDVALDPTGNLYIADFGNHAIRRIDSANGIITTVAGNGVQGFTDDGSPSTQTQLRFPAGVTVGPAGHLYICDTDNHRIRRVDAATGIVTTVAGIGTNFWDSGYAGDGGPATEASLNIPTGVAIGHAGHVYIADAQNNRIRKVFRCVDVGEPQLLLPSAGAANLSRAPELSWSAVEGAFFYNLFLDTVSPPQTEVASSLDGTSFRVQNLTPGTIYYWRVFAIGDPFCKPPSVAASEVRSFATATICGAPDPPTLVYPAQDAPTTGTSVELSWQRSPSAGLFDVHFGPTNPPPFIKSTTSDTLTVSGLVPATTYYWSIVAHASCDGTRTSRSEVRSFNVVGSCSAAGPLTLISPVPGAATVPTTTTFRWSRSDNASGYDFFLGTTNPPQLFLPGLKETGLGISGLLSGQTYHWRVKANVDCDATRSATTEIASFTTTDDCQSPEAARILFAPPGAVGVGQTYAITWSEAKGLDAGGTYLVERSVDASFTTILDTQETSTSSATFLAEAAGTHYVRVRPVTRCNPSIKGPVSGAIAVQVAAASPNVIFTVEPEAVIATPGSALEDLKTSFTVENISSETVKVILSDARIASVPFFTIRDPFGGDSVFVELEPRTPRRFEIQFSGPPNDVEASYQGLIVVTAPGSEVVPYAFVNLKVGDRASASPEFRMSGTTTEYAYFPGFDGDDATRPPITVEVRNRGSTPMELGAEIGPEVWLEPEAAWNDTPIPAGGTRQVNLHTRRHRAINDSALPRYTYFTVRTRTGETARLLVQDNGAASVGSGRTTTLDGAVRSLIVPEILSDGSGSSARISRVRLTNLGSDTVQALLTFTPEGVDGFTSDARRATVLIPPNDVVTLTDPLVQVFGLARPARGQLEIVTSEEKIGLLAVDASLVSEDRDDASLVRLPVLARGSGARPDAPHRVAGITSRSGVSTDLVLVETSGTDSATVTVELFDSTGTSKGQRTLDVQRYGYERIDDLVSVLGGVSSLTTGWLDIVVTEGGGSVSAIAKIVDDTTGRGTAIASQLQGSASDLFRREARSHSRRGTQQGALATLVAPYVASGVVEDGAVRWSTLMGFLAPTGGAITFEVIFTDSSGASMTKTVSVESGTLVGQVVEYANVIEELFGITGPTEGSITVNADPRGQVYARLEADGLPMGNLALVSTVSGMKTGAGSRRPLYVDGLAQSIDPQRGVRWNVYVGEVAGGQGTFKVRLYEAGNRSSPIALGSFSIGPYGLVRLETVFAALDLDSQLRRKNRTNVLCIVTPESGDAEVMAVALEIDNRSGVATSHLLQPTCGLSPEGDPGSLVRLVEPVSPSTRRHPVRPGGGG